MIAIMSAGSTRQDVDRVQRHLEERRLRGQLNAGVKRTVIGVLGEEYPELQNDLELMGGSVSEAARIFKPYKLASREFTPNDSAIKIGAGGVSVGGGRFMVFSGALRC